jgi:hypothetical protein
MYKNIKLPILFITLSIIASAGCHTSKKNKADADNEQVNMHSAYDDSTLNNKILPVLMPYNRVIDPAGKVIAFGDPADENHSMDVKLIPGTTSIAVEDRFGIAVIDTVKQKVTARWAYTSDAKYSGLMSTYSGLKVLKSNQKTYIFWSAAVAKGRQSHSYVFQAEWNGEKLNIANAK